MKIFPAAEVLVRELWNISAPTRRFRQRGSVSWHLLAVRKHARKSCFQTSEEAEFERRLQQQMKPKIHMSAIPESPSPELMILMDIRGCHHGLSQHCGLQGQCNYSCSVWFSIAAKTKNYAEFHLRAGIGTLPLIMFPFSFQCSLQGLPLKTIKTVFV